MKILKIIRLMKGEKKLCMGICNRCGKDVLRIFKNGNPTWIITTKGIFHKYCFKNN